MNYGVIKIYLSGGHFEWAGIAKWFKAPVLKTGALRSAWVRIPFPAPFFWLLVLGGRILVTLFGL